MLEQASKHFSSSLFRGVDFDGSTVGLANTNAMCTSNSGAVNEVNVRFCLTRAILVCKNTDIKRKSVGIV